MLLVLWFGAGLFFKGLDPPPGPGPMSFEERQSRLEAFKPILARSGAGKIGFGLQALEKRLKNNPPTDPNERQELERRIQALREREAGLKKSDEPKKE
jgi:hypothetical protein